MLLTCERSVDELGRIVLPAALRRKFDLREGSRLSLRENEQGEIVLHRLMPSCRICGAEMQEEDELVICADCVRAIRESK